MSIVVYQGSILLSGNITEDNEFFYSGDRKAHKPSFPGAELVNVDMPTEGHWGYVNGKFVDLDEANAEAQQQEQEMHDAELAAMAAIVRQKRNELLAQSDWTQVLDAPVDQGAWATYRQALRDITKQEGFPKEVQWPEAPK
jgi:hypothetical protein